MSARRFYHPDLHAQVIELDDAQAQHARKVLRLSVGDTVSLFDGSGGAATGRISRCDKRVEVTITERRTAPWLKPTIELAVCIPKGDRAGFLVEKASELGADTLIPLLATRSVVDPGEGKIERFARMATESAKQCGRPWVMQVAEPIDFAKLIASAEHDVKLIADVPESSGVPGVHSEQIMPGQFAEAGRLIVLIGPEGGWTDEERKAAFSSGFRPVRLGPHVMRIETAALAALAILRGRS